VLGARVARVLEKYESWVRHFLNPVALFGSVRIRFAGIPGRKDVATALEVLFDSFGLLRLWQLTFFEHLVDVSTSDENLDILGGGHGNLALYLLIDLPQRFFARVLDILYDKENE
jgi:hypothetical protein